MAEKKISIGGQALIEGIMMKSPEKYSIAVRKPDGTIDVQIFDNNKVKFQKVPVLRGIMNFFDSLMTGYKCIMHSAEIAMDGEMEEDKLDLWLKEKFGEKSSEIIATIAGILGTVLALVLFMVLPTTIAGLVDKIIPLGGFKTVVEGVAKLTIFVLYLWLVSKMEDIRRVFCYHGAEHKTIACFEAGQPLTVENVKKYTRFHPRCGTSMMFIILIVSIVVFSFVPWKGTLSRALMKVVFLPVVVGIAYEILKYTGRHTNACTKILAAPGLWFQRLTTNEPEDDMIEIAIASVNALLPETIVEKEVKESDEQP